MIFLRPCWPLTIIICDELTLSILAKKLIHILFSLGYNELIARDMMRH